MQFGKYSSNPAIISYMIDKENNVGYVKNATYFSIQENICISGLQANTKIRDYQGIYNLCYLTSEFIPSLLPYFLFC